MPLEKGANATLGELEGLRLDVPTARCDRLNCALDEAHQQYEQVLEAPFDWLRAWKLAEASR